MSRSLTSDTHPPFIRTAERCNSSNSKTTWRKNPRNEGRKEGRKEGSSLRNTRCRYTGCALPLGPVVAKIRPSYFPARTLSKRRCREQQIMPRVQAQPAGKPKLRMKSPWDSNVPSTGPAWYAPANNTRTTATSCTTIRTLNNPLCAKHFFHKHYTSIPGSRHYRGATINTSTAVLSCHPG